LLNRWILGYVIDFINISFGGFFWPVFNLADSAIVLGVLILTFLWYFSEPMTSAQ
jgi:signal peptidase II